jgi:guanyl-specific ribonuclease Sa
MDGLKKLLAVCMCFTLCACTKPTASNATGTAAAISEDVITDQKEEVAEYLLTYQHLPSCYMTKKEARKQGWSGGALNQTISSRCIGGDVYSNYEETLPVIKGKYYECDIDTLTKKTRGAERIIYDDDKKDIDIYYTGDHYETFTLLYGDGNYE